MKWNRKILTWIPAIIMMAIIYRFSSAEGEQSSGFSLSLTEKIVNTVKDIVNVDINQVEEIKVVDKLHTYIRKYGHLAEYAILAITFAYPLYVYHKRGWQLVLWCGGLCFIYACSDELHQLYVSGRSGQFSDIFIDSVGICIGIIIFYIMLYITKKVKLRFMRKAF